MYCQNDFRRFVGELLCVKHGKVTLRSINQVINKLTQENIAVSYFLEKEREVGEQQSQNEMESASIQITDH